MIMESYDIDMKYLERNKNKRRNKKKNASHSEIIKLFRLPWVYDCLSFGEAGRRYVCIDDIDVDRYIGVDIEDIKYMFIRYMIV